MTIACPNCGSTEFEKRGERRVYAPLPEGSFEVDGWNEEDPHFITWDTDDKHNEIIYCRGCDDEFTEIELREANSTPAA